MGLPSAKALADRPPGRTEYPALRQRFTAVRQPADGIIPGNRQMDLHFFSAAKIGAIGGFGINGTDCRRKAVRLPIPGSDPLYIQQLQGNGVFNNPLQIAPARILTVPVDDR